MSNWTHVIGSLYVDTYTKRKNIKKYVEKILLNAPKITGSEADCDIFVNHLNGHNTFSYKIGKNNDFIEYQTCVCITLAGDFRDRCMKQTEKEFNDFIKFIKENFIIFYSSITIYEEYSGEIKQFKEDWK